jgi:hypothetical protein
LTQTVPARSRSAIRIARRMLPPCLQGRICG